MFERKQFDYQAVTIKIPMKKAEKLEKEAGTNMRTLSKHILYIILKYVDNLENPKVTEDT